MYIDDDDEEDEDDEYDVPDEDPAAAAETEPVAEMPSPTRCRAACGSCCAGEPKEARVVEDRWVPGIEEGTMESGDAAQSGSMEGENGSILWSMVKQASAIDLRGARLTHACSCGRAWTCRRSRSRRSSWSRARSSTSSRTASTIPTCSTMPCS